MKALASPEFSILIATMGKRTEKFLGLLEDLLPQAETYKGLIEVVAYWNNGEIPIGEIRQALVEDARGEYLCFVDDDDELPDYYCDEIMLALGKDYIGFKVKVLNDGMERPTAFHSIRYKRWHQDDAGYYRGVTHLNPIKKYIALAGTFAGEAGEDERWARTVTPYVEDENYIDKVMYTYHHDSRSSNFGGDELGEELKRPTINNKYFRWHPHSKRGARWNEEFSPNQS